MPTLDTHAIARTLTDAGADPKLADAITAAIRQAAEHDNAAEPLATKRDVAELKSDLIRWFATAILAQTGVILAALVAVIITIVRTLGT